MSGEAWAAESAAWIQKPSPGTALKVMLSRTPAGASTPLQAWTTFQRLSACSGQYCSTGTWSTTTMLSRFISRPAVAIGASYFAAAAIRESVWAGVAPCAEREDDRQPSNTATRIEERN